MAGFICKQHTSLKVYLLDAFCPGGTLALIPPVAGGLRMQNRGCRAQDWSQKSCTLLKKGPKAGGLLPSETTCNASFPAGKTARQQHSSSAVLNGCQEAAYLHITYPSCSGVCVPERDGLEEIYYTRVLGAIQLHYL